jgi:SNF2 family DNA or RNA helicase
MFKPDMIICDESQRIKTHNAAQSKALHKLGDNAKYKLILTGTPVQNSPLDTFSQWRFLDKNIFGTSYFAFKAHYAVMGGYGNHKVMGYINKDELIIKAHSIAYRVTKEEALDLPDQIDEMRYCKLEPKAQRVYENIRRENFAELVSGEISTTNVLTRLLRLSQITGGFVSDDDGDIENISNSKLSALSEIIDDVMSADKKIVIFARFVEEMKAIRVLLEGKDLAYSFIAGEVKMADRGQEVETFQNDPNCKVFLAQIQTAGLGITLTAADTAVFYSLDFNYANYSQARARIHRIGQKNNCTYIHLLVKNSVDEKIMDALAAKKSIAAEIVDNWRFYFE